MGPRFRGDDDKGEPEAQQICYLNRKRDDGLGLISRPSLTLLSAEQPAHAAR
jgi:hypothetical protein